MIEDGAQTSSPTVEDRDVLPRTSSVSAVKPPRRVLFLAGILSAATAVIWGSLFTVNRFVDRDAFDYAQIGRQIAQHKGFTTRQVFPRHIPYLDEKGLLRESEWPSLLRYPIPPVANAAAQTILGDPSRSAVVQSGLWFLLTVPVFFLLIERFSDLRSATLGTVLLIGDPRIWRDAYNGMTESLAVLLQLCFFFVALRESTLSGHRRSWLLLGAVCGVAFLVRTQSAVFVPLGFVLIFAIPDNRRRFSCVMAFSGSAAAAVSPWFVRNFIVTGDPTFAFTNTRNLLAKTLHHSRIDVELHAPVDLPTVLTSYGDEIAAKILAHLWPNVINPLFWVEVLGWYAMAYLVVIAFRCLSTNDDYKIRVYTVFQWVLPVLIGLNFIVVSMIYHRQRYYDPLLPLIMIVLAVSGPRLLEMGLAKLWPRGAPSRNAVIFVLILIAGLRAGSTYVDHVRQPGISASDHQSYEMLGSWVNDDVVVASDLSAQITLFCGVRTLRLPKDLQDLREIDDRYMSIDLIVFGRQGGQARMRSFQAMKSFIRRFERMPDLPNSAVVFRKRGPGNPGPQMIIESDSRETPLGATRVSVEQPR